MVDKKEILNQIVNVLEKPFVTHGFRYVRGGRFVRKLSDGNTEQQYHITQVSDLDFEVEFIA